MPTEAIWEFVSITRKGKQRSPISIVHRSLTNVTPLLHVCRRHRRELLYHIALSAVWPREHVMDHVPRGFIPQPDWLLKIFRGNGRRKIYGNATRPLFQMGPGDEATYFRCSKCNLHQMVVFLSLAVSSFLSSPLVLLAICKSFNSPVAPCTKRGPLFCTRIEKIKYLICLHVQYAGSLMATV